jgi:hypothetical protein
MKRASRNVSTSLLWCLLLTVFPFGFTVEAAPQTAGTFIPAGNMFNEEIAAGVDLIEKFPSRGSGERS